MRGWDTRDTNSLLSPTYTELKIIIIKVQISHQPSDLFSGLKTSTSIILWGKPIFQLESSDVSCKQLLSILPQKSFALLSPSHSAELRHSPGQCVLKLTLCVPEESLCLKLHLLLQNKALSKLKTLYCTEIVTSIKPTGVFLFCLMFFENTNPQNFVKSPLPKSILLFKNFLAIPQYHLGNLLIPDTFFRNSMMFQGNFWQQKSISSSDLPVICYTESKTTPAFHSALQLAELCFSHLLSLLYRMCYCTALTEQKRHFMATHSTDHSTSHWLLCTKNIEVAMTP